MDTAKLLEIEALSVRYGDRLALNQATLSVEKGEILALIGPNGAGKSTLLRAVSGVVSPHRGAIRVAGQELTRLSPEQRASQLAVVPQARQLPESFTAWHTVLLGRTPYLGWLGRPGPSDLERVRWAMETTDTLAFSDRPVGELSGGEQQLVLLARALAQSTPILLLDEPTAHLDLRHQVRLLDLVRALARENGLAVLMALHDLNLVPLYADRVALLVEGSICALGVPAEVLTSRQLSEAYRIPLEVILHPHYGTPLVLPDGHPARPLVMGPVL